MSKVEHMHHSTPTTHPYQGELHDLESPWGCLGLRQCFTQYLPLILTWGTDVQVVPKCHGSCGKSVHVNIDMDTHYYVMKNVYVPGEFRRPHINVNTVFMEQHGGNYIRTNADLEMRPQIRSKGHLKCMYSECLD